MTVTHTHADARNEIATRFRRPSEDAGTRAYSDGDDRNKLIDMITQTVTSVCDVAAISVGVRPRTTRGRPPPPPKSVRDDDFKHYFKFYLFIFLI